MKGQLLLKALGGTTQAALLSGMGAGGSLLLTEEPKKVIEVGEFGDSGRVVTDYKSKGSWDYYLKFSTAKFSVNCSGTGDDEGNCTRQIESKYKDSESNVQQIQVYLNEVPADQKMGGWTEYEFTYKEEIEKGKGKKYFGDCFPANEGDANNICADTNLPDGWSKEKVDK